MPKKIIIENIIGYDVTAEDVRDQLSNAGGDDVVVEIASPGGLISEGLKIYNALKNYEGNVDVHLTGMVASMATYIAMVGNHRTAEKNAVFMIHNGRMLAFGDQNIMFKAGKHLDSLSNMIAKEYAVKSDTPLPDIRSAMDDETFYYGDEIQEAGFVHDIIGDSEPENRDEAIAAAELMIQECELKISTPETVKNEIKALATMLADVPDKGAGNIKNKKKEMEDLKMTLEEMKEKFPALYNQIVNEAREQGVKDGIAQERERVKMLAELRGKFQKAHSQKVIDQAIADGDDMNKLTLNLMAAEQAAKELEEEQNSNPETPKTNTDDEDDSPEMEGDEMTHPDHIDKVSMELASLPGVIN